MEYLNLKSIDDYENNYQAQLQTCLKSPENNCKNQENFDKIYKYIESDYKTFNNMLLYLSISIKTPVSLNEKTVKFIESPYPLDEIVNNFENVNKELCEGFPSLNNNNNFEILSFDLSKYTKLSSKCFKNNIINKSYHIIWPFLITTVLSIIYLPSILVSIVSLIIFIITIIISFLIYGLLTQNATFPLTNFVSLFMLFCVNLKDSFLWSATYNKTRLNLIQTNHSSNGTCNQIPKNVRPVKILSSIINQIYYFLLPRNVSFILILLISFLNQIYAIQMFSLFSSILFIVYLFVSFFSYLLIASVLCRCNYNLLYRHHVKIFKIDVNLLIEKIFSTYLPYLVENFKILWLVFLTCAWIGSVLTIFYGPKLNFDINSYEFKFNWDLSHPLDSNRRLKENFNAYQNTKSKKLDVYLVWGSRIDESSNQLGFKYKNPETTEKIRNHILNLFDKNMEYQAFQQFKQINQLCKEINKSIKDKTDSNSYNLNLLGNNLDLMDNLMDQSGFKYTKTLSNKEFMSKNFKRAVCFTNSFYETLLNESINWHEVINLSNYAEKLKNMNLNEFESLRNTQTLLNSSTAELIENYCEPSFKNPNYNKLNTKSAYLYCMKWWSSRLYLISKYDSSLNENDFYLGPLYVLNRGLPSVFIIKIETEIEITNDYRSLKQAFNQIENWWKGIVKDLFLPESYVWWTSDSFANYLIQKKLNQQLLISTLVSFLFIFALNIYVCSNLFISICVSINIIQIFSTTIALSVWLGFSIDLLTCVLYILTIFVACHYSLTYGISYRFAPHMKFRNCLNWSLSNYGDLVLVFYLTITLGSIPMVVSKVDFFYRTGCILIISNTLGYVYSTFYLPSLISLKSNNTMQSSSNANNRNNMGSRDRTQSFSPSISPSTLYSNAATGSMYLEEIKELNENRSKMRARCNSLQITKPRKSMFELSGLKSRNRQPNRNFEMSLDNLNSKRTSAISSTVSSNNNLLQIPKIRRKSRRFSTNTGNKLFINK